VLNAAAVALALSLAQDPEPAAAPAADPAPAAAPADPAAAAPAAPAAPARPKGADEVARMLQRIGSLSAADRAAALDALTKQYGQVDTNPVLPTNDIDLDKYLSLAAPQQVEVVARAFFNDLVAGDTNRLVLRSGYPFFMETKRIDRPEDLRAAWGRSLRSRRTDLLKVYSVEPLLPADMEKKYGKPPQRLSAWPTKSPNTYFAVGNLSGHATILMLRQAGAAWQVVGFHD
jgi:hypothetical protein